MAPKIAGPTLRHERWAADYCRTFEIDAKDLYAAKQCLVKKGMLPPPAKPSAAEEDKLSDFVAIQVAPKARRRSCALAMARP